MNSLEPDSITTWEEFHTKFITRYFPPAKADKVKTDIMSFAQNGDETLVEAWERFKRMLIGVHYLTPIVIFLVF